MRIPPRVGGLGSAVVLLVGSLGVAPLPATAEPIAFKLLSNYSRATFKTDAQLETIVGTTAGPGLSGAVRVDPARPQGATGVIRVDLSTVNSGVAKRDADMKGPDYLDTANEANRYAVFEVKGVEIAGPLEPGKELAARVTGVLTIKGKPVERVVEARLTYLRLAPRELENYKRFGSDHIQVETDLTLVRQ